MGFKVSYQPVGAIAAAGQQIGAGRAAQEQSERQQQSFERAIDRQFRAQQSQQDRVSDIQKMMLGAGLNAQRDQQNFSQQKELASFNAQQRAQMAAEDDERYKKLKEWEATEEQRQFETRATMADRKELDKINGNVAAIKRAAEAGTIRPEEADRMILDQETRGAAAKAGVLKRPQQLPFPQLPPNQQPGMPPFPMQGPDGKPMLRADGSPMLATTEVRDGHPRLVPWEDPADKEARAHKLKAQEAEHKAKLDEEKSFNDWIDANSEVEEEVDGPPGLDGKPTKVLKKRPATDDELLAKIETREKLRARIEKLRGARGGQGQQQQQATPIGPNQGGGPGPQSLGSSNAGGGSLQTTPSVSKDQDRVMKAFADAGTAPVEQMPPHIQQVMMQKGQASPTVITSKEDMAMLTPGEVFLAPNGEIKVFKGRGGSEDVTGGGGEDTISGELDGLGQEPDMRPQASPETTLDTFSAELTRAKGKVRTGGPRGGGKLR